MANINDIIIKYKNEDEIFNEYLDIKILGDKIYKSFKTLYDKNKGFPISSEERKYGIISNVMGLSTMLELYSMGVDISTFEKGFKFLIKYIFDKTYKNGVKSAPVYSATPYLSSEDEIQTYVETASKITIVMNDLRQYAHKENLNNKKFGEPILLDGYIIDSFSSLAELSEKLLIDGVKFLVDAALEVKENEIKEYDIDDVIIDRIGMEKKIKYRGWSFCHHEGESNKFDTSIYYTFHATNVYVEIYNTYQEILKELYEKKYGVFTKESSDNLIDDYDDDIEKKLYEINKSFLYANIDLIDKFKLITSSSGRYVEKEVEKNGIDISFDYVGTLFKKVTSSQVMDMQDNNAVINTLFVVAIYINSGIDEDYESQGEEQKKWFYNQLQYSIDNIKKIYNYLRTKEQHESIDTFNIRNALFIEKAPSKYNEVTKNLRIGCRNISLYDLVPLLCNTYSIIFDYIIRYPQVSMVENLELIMNKCSSGEQWIWGDETSNNISFNANNNLYSILAIENFYKYYNEYESPLSNNLNEYNKKVNTVTQQYKNEKISYENRIERLIAERDEYKQKYIDKNSILDEEVIRLANDTFNNKFEEMFQNHFKNMLNELIDFSVLLSKGNMTNEQIGLHIKNNEKLKTILSIGESYSIVHQIKSHKKSFGDYKDLNDEDRMLINNIIIDMLSDSLKN